MKFEPGDGTKWSFKHTILRKTSGTKSGLQASLSDIIFRFSPPQEEHKVQLKAKVKNVHTLIPADGIANLS